MARRLVIVVTLVPFISVTLTIFAFFLLQSSRLYGDRQFAGPPLEVGQSYGFMGAKISSPLVGQVQDRERDGWIKIQVQDKNELTGRVTWLDLRDISIVVILTPEDVEKLRAPEVPLALNP